MRTYSQRLLNPFRGIMSIIEYQGAEAVTIDGAHWDIYVRDTGLVEDMEHSEQVQTSDIRYGSWSAEDGLRRGAIHPSEHFRRLEHRGALVYDYLRRHHAAVPFALQDHYELWLLGEDGDPLGLLHSVVREEEMAFDGPIDWRAGLECRRSFHSDAGGDTAPAAGDRLTGCINRMAGAQPMAQWFLRRPDGSGQGLDGIRLDPALQARSLPQACFPRFFLREDAGDPDVRRLVQDFLGWLAPSLLLLQDLDVDTRHRFEQAAVQRASAVERLFRLYPQILDQDAINAARVEAMLRSQDPQPTDTDSAMATYYIEL